MFKSNITLLLFAITAATLAAPSAHAYEWRYGHWSHDRHMGRLGWWWVVGPAWYYYPQPRSYVVVQQAPQPVVIQQAPPVVVTQSVPVVTPLTPPVAMTPVLYYCNATGTQYPETMTCPGGWSTMTAETPPKQ